MILVSLKAAILGFIALEPTSGYTLKKRFDGSLRSFWTATQSQIYRELHGLEREGLVAAADVPGDGKPASKVYSLTTSGRAALRQWLEEAPAPLMLRHPLLLKFVFAADLSPQALDGLLERYADNVKASRRDYLARLDDENIFSLARSGHEERLWRLAIEHGLAWCDMELAWLARARRVTSRNRGEREKRAWTRKAG